jgi:hypothetical protein
MTRARVLIFAALGSILGLAACRAAERSDDPGGDSDADGDSDSDGDADSDADAGPIPMDCSDCPAVGSTLEHMLCAFDICDPEVVESHTYTAQTALEGCALEDTYEAVAHFGSPGNGLGAQLNESYALMASGIAVGTTHSGYCTSSMTGGTDPYSTEGFTTYDPFDWRITLTAPSGAEGFQFKYVFFSEEYDDYIGTSVNDKFYVLLNADESGANGTVINFTNCRDPDTYYDFICESGDPGCTVGERYCYVAINSALSDCCWYNNCPDGTSAMVGTDISGTGFECAPSMMEDGDFRGSSTGWLQTSWPIGAGETFTLTFHIHDTSDGIFDSEVILDSFQFITEVEQGTIPIE